MKKLTVRIDDGLYGRIRLPAGGTLNGYVCSLIEKDIEWKAGMGNKIYAGSRAGKTQFTTPAVETTWARDEFSQA